MLSAAETDFPMPAGWRAALELSVEVRGGRSVLRRAASRGPLRVQRAFYPEPGADLPHLYLLHPPGGVVGGDELSIDVEVATGASALVTTPAAGKLYRHRDRRARQSVSCAVADGATFEWLPQETIAFSGSRANLALTAELAPTAGFIGWEIVVLGRPACGERFADGALDQRIEIRRAGRPLVLERALIDPADGPGGLAAAPWGLRGEPVHGTLIAVAPAGVPDLADDLDAVRAAAGDRAAVTLVEPDVLVGRYLGPSAPAARALFERIRAAVRPAWLGRAALAPRIWAT
jgi:urease accessory protein